MRLVREEIREESKKQLIEDAKKRRRAALEKALGGDLPVDEYTFEKFDPDLNGSHSILRAALSFDPLRDNLFICGGQGKGKTHLMCAIARRILDNHGTAQIFRGRELAAALKGRRTYASDHDEVDAINDIAKIHVLGIDDIELGRKRDAYIEALPVLLDHRKNRRIFGCIITSNKTVGELSELLSPKIADRIEEFKHLVIPESIPSARGILKRGKK